MSDSLVPSSLSVSQELVVLYIEKNMKIKYSRKEALRILSHTHKHTQSYTCEPESVVPVQELDCCNVKFDILEYVFYRL